jgi:hypothetical protein
MFDGCPILRRESFVPATNESQAWTRAFARFFGPLLTIVPIILAVRWPDMGTLVADFFKSPIIFVFGAIAAMGIYFTYVGWLAKPASPAVKNDP